MTNYSGGKQALRQTATDARHEHRHGGPGTQMRRLLWWLVGGTRGGKNRLRIIRALHERPLNTNQLSNELDLNYKTVQHHLEMLTDNGVLTTSGEEYGKLFFLTPKMDDNLDLLDDIAERTAFDDGD
ncbi:Bacterial regulatory protein, arsR family [Haloferax massiliensis]|uniref:Bacterial regulatory protein, arsR family n=2 Tax=Haloferacaceae TaxID=1644056 RepID=A0A0D6JMH9_9EURY|nr:Bacterial regulatory protein, arsR family [Haloferax massiliensis]